MPVPILIKAKQVAYMEYASLKKGGKRNQQEMTSGKVPINDHW